jgi:UDP-N-acetylmuramyl pentapeptide phosphotransferase/UDP-N-acetylglucosamine-1-phosphate transferase
MINLTPLLSFTLSYFCLQLLLKGKMLEFALDHPNDRSLHSSPVPRTGGVAILAGALLGWLVLDPGRFAPFALGSVAVMMVSLADDLKGISVGWRLLAHFAITSVFLTICLQLNLDWFWLVAAGVAVVWMTNLYNFMDGSDGLAAGMAIIGFGSYAIAAKLAGDTGLAIAMGCIAGTSLAFLRFNFYPARIFMGDAGSVPLGFLSAVFGLMGWQQGLWPLWFPLMVFSPFVIDATATLFKRLLGGEKIWQAHRSHYYQRLIQMGWGHKRTAMLEYTLMLACAASALLVIHLPLKWHLPILILWVVIYTTLMVWVDKLWKRHLGTL